VSRVTRFRLRLEGRNCTNSATEEGLTALLSMAAYPWPNWREGQDENASESQVRIAYSCECRDDVMQRGIMCVTRQFR
jgi:hypothetical protein